jgi:hypothetical protein
MDSIWVLFGFRMDFVLDSIRILSGCHKDSVRILHELCVDSALVLWIPYGFCMYSAWICKDSVWILRMDSVWTPYGFRMDSVRVLSGVYLWIRCGFPAWSQCFAVLFAHIANGSDAPPSTMNNQLSFVFRCEAPPPRAGQAAHGPKAWAGPL